MNKGFIAFMAGLLVSFMFGVGFMYLQPQQIEKEVTVSFLQTGVYQTKDNALNMQTQLQTVGLESYLYQNESHYYVICGISTNKEELASFETVLNENGINFVKKEKTIINEKDKEKLIDNLLEALTT